MTSKSSGSHWMLVVERRSVPRMRVRGHTRLALADFLDRLSIKPSVPVRQPQDVAVVLLCTLSQCLARIRAPSSPKLDNLVAPWCLTISLAAMHALVVGISEDWWRIALDIVVAVGTVGGALAAWWAARKANRIAGEDRRHASALAQEDRAERKERDERERSRDNLRWRLDRLDAVARAFEAFAEANRMHPDYEGIDGRLRAALGASPDPLPRAREAAAAGRPVRERDTDADKERMVVVRKEIHRAIRESRPELLGR